MSTPTSIDMGMKIRRIVVLLFSALECLQAEVQIYHSYRVISNTHTEHYFYAIQLTGPGSILEIELNSPFANGTEMESRPFESEPVFSSPSGWTASIKTEEGSETRSLSFEALPGHPGLAPGGSALFKVTTTDESFKQEMHFNCYADIIRSNWSGMTIPVPSFPTADRIAFTQEFTYFRGQYVENLTGRPEAWGFSGVNWKIPNADADFPDFIKATSEIKTVWNSENDYQLRSDVFPSMVSYSPGTSGFEVQFKLKFNDNWDGNADNAETGDETTNWVQTNSFSFCLDNSVEATTPWCLYLSPNTPGSAAGSRTNVYLVSSRSQISSAVLSQPAETPAGDGQESGGWLTVRMEFKPSNEIRVFIGPSFDEPLENCIIRTSPFDFQFNRLLINYQTGPALENTHSISMDDFLVKKTFPEPAVTGLTLDPSGSALKNNRIFIGSTYAVNLSEPVDGANVEVYVGGVRAEVISSNGNSIVFRAPKVIGNPADLVVKINGQSTLIPYKVKSGANLAPVLQLLLD